MKLANKTALITGASRGLGRAILLQLAREGAYVIGTATSATGVAAIEALLAEHRLQGEAQVLDVTQATQIEECVKTLQDKQRLPLILVNNAGITRDNLLLRMTEADWQAVLDTNLTSVFRLSKALLRPMMQVRWGRIINIGSVVGTTGNPGQVNYCAAKAGLIGFTKALAQEIASRNITVNVVAPGFIKTDMTDSLSEAYREGLLAKIPLNRIGEPENIAAIVSFLASDGASYITGQTLHVNGGMAML